MRDLGCRCHVTILYVVNCRVLTLLYLGFGQFLFLSFSFFWGLWIWTRFLFHLIFRLSNINMNNKNFYIIVLYNYNLYEFSLLLPWLARLVDQKNLPDRLYLRSAFRPRHRHTYRRYQILYAILHQ